MNTLILRVQLSRYLIIAVIFAFGLVGCSQNPASTTIVPVKLKTVEGADFIQIILSEKAAQRLGITESTVVNDLSISEQRFEGEITLADNTTIDARYKNSVFAWVQLDQADIENVDKSIPAQIFLVENGNEELVWYANWYDGVEDTEGGLYYEVKDPEHQPNGKCKVLVSLGIKNNPELHIIVPVDSVFYGQNGETWVYTAIHPRTYVRYPIQIKNIHGDSAVLINGPPIGSTVVSAGGSALRVLESGNEAGK